MKTILQYWVQQACLGFVKTEKHESESSVAEANDSKDFVQKLDFTHCFLVKYTHQFFVPCPLGITSALETLDSQSIA